MNPLWAGLIPLLPLLAAMLIGVTRLMGWNRGEPGERPTARLALLASGMALLLLLGFSGEALFHNAAPGQVELFTWMESDGFHIRASLTLDRLSLSMGTLVGLIGFFTLKFSVNYMHREEGFQRFFATLSLFLAAMLLIVLAGNPLVMFLGWELAGVSSYLLIGYALDRTTATGNATRAFITNRFGDAGFILAIALSHRWLAQLEWPDLLQGAQQVDLLHVGLILSGFLLAALAKSAQLPFAAWLHRALEGPTPSSAIFYGSLMVHAGVFLLLRLEPILIHAPLVRAALVLLGGLTVLYGVLVGLVQTDVKSAFIFSTQSQVGLMFLTIGLGWFEVAFWHMLAHAAWRAFPFLSAPAYMHLIQGRARPAPGWLTRCPTLYAMAIRRFWLDPLGEMLVVHPTQALARDAQTFDDRAIDRMVGHTTHGGRVPASLGEWETRHLHEDEELHAVAWGRGLPGRMLEHVGRWLHWFEERLLLSSGGGGLMRALHGLARYLELTDRLLSLPRYLLLLIVLTFVVIL